MYAGLESVEDVSTLVAQLDSTQSELEAGNAALLRQHLPLVQLLAEDAVSLTGAMQARSLAQG